MTKAQSAAVALAAVPLVGWLAFLVVGHARGSVKRLAFRATLLGLAAGLLILGRQSGALAQAGQAGRLIVLSVVGLLLLSYLYLVRFCPACGRMHRNFKLSACGRCGAALPEHGSTTRLRRVPPPLPRPPGPRRLPREPGSAG